MLKVIGGAQEGEFTATASGALPNGKPVVVNADGTVSAVEEDSVSQATGTPTLFESASTSYISSAFDSSSNKVVVAYSDTGNSGYGTAVVGTVSGTSISFGTPVVFNSTLTDWISVTFDSNANKVVVSYRFNAAPAYGDGTSRVGTVSGTSISFGTATAFDSSDSDYITSTFDSNSNKVVIAYRDGGSPDNYGAAVVGTVSGTSISFGSAVYFNSARTVNNSITFDSGSNKVVIAYTDQGNSNYGTALVGTVSGTSISFGSEVVFNSGLTTGLTATYDQNAQKVVVAYSDGGNSSYGTALVGTVSGTSISFGTEVVFETAIVGYNSATYDANSGKIVIAYQDSGNSSYGTLIAGTVSGTSISFASPVVFENATTNYISAAYDSDAQKVVISYQDNGNSSYGTAVVFQAAYTTINLTSENYIGISSGGAVADTGNATVDIVGTVNKDQSGLTAGEKYYVQTDGTLSTTADDPSVLAGTAISATKLVVKT